MLGLVQEIQDVDEERTLRAILRNAVSLPASGDPVTPLETILDVIAEVNRAEPNAGGSLRAEDYRRVIGNVTDFMTDQDHGLRAPDRRRPAAPVPPGERSSLQRRRRHDGVERIVLPRRDVHVHGHRRSPGVALHRSLIVATFLSLSALALLPGRAAAGGFYLADRGVRPLGRGGAFVAGVDDPHALWYNPAGLSWSGDQLLIDASLTLFETNYARIDGGGNLLPAVNGHHAYLPIPTVAGSFSIDELPNFTFGLGVMAPNSALMEWPQEIELDGMPYPAPQRYSLPRWRAACSPRWRSPRPGGRSRSSPSASRRTSSSGTSTRAWRSAPATASSAASPRTRSTTASRRSACRCSSPSSCSAASWISTRCASA
ncbi:MAG: outer membrane protein transport protein [Sandaracinaceae bacterium]|nr:outer membrane protein transport protein [Sandaracinaceae bacterium]